MILEWSGKVWAREANLVISLLDICKALGWMRASGE